MFLRKLLSKKYLNYLLVFVGKITSEKYSDTHAFLSLSPFHLINKTNANDRKFLRNASEL